MKGKPLSRFKEDVSIVLCGEAGQGIQTVEHILTQTLKLSGYHVFSTEEYMSRIRGGSNSTLVRVSSSRISANGTAQFGQLIRLQTGFDMDHKILKYNGLPFSVEELEKRLKSVLD